MKQKYLFLPLTAALLLSLPATPALAIYAPEPPSIPVVPPPPPVVPVGIAVQAAQISANTINVTQFKGGNPVAQDLQAAEAEKTVETVTPPENAELAPKSPRN